MIDHALNILERAGNRLPHPTMLFVYLCVLVLLMSAISAALGVSAQHPKSGDIITVMNLLSSDGISRVLTYAVSNFTQFAPVGTVLVAMLGLGVAERSGLIGVLLAKAVARARGAALTFVVVFAGVMSSLAADAGYVVLIPLAALLFHAAGRHPLAGIAAAFAGVSGGYSANLLLGPFDALLAGISTEAARMVDPEASVSIAANYGFMVASVLLISVIATWVTSRFVEPRLATLAVDIPEDDMPETTTKDGRGLRAAGLTLVAIVLFFASGLYAPDAWLRQGNELLASAFMKGIVVVISLSALLCGLAFARASGRWQRSDDLITAMENSMAGMAGYLVLMFFAAQFTSWFGWSQLGIITAITGADFLTSLNASPIILLLGFVLIAALINLFIGSGSAKWALLAPVFVPMLMLVGIAPETAQVAFRIGDSSTNIITPLMPYFGVVLAFAQRYRADLGIGTVMAMMLPYSIAFLLGWSALLALWLGFGWPLGW